MQVTIHGRIQDFKLGGGALKKIAPSGERRENVCGILCEKSRFYAKKNHIFSNFRRGVAGCNTSISTENTVGENHYGNIIYENKRGR